LAASVHDARQGNVHLRSNEPQIPSLREQRV
jgi:hypothetical protein